MLERRDSMDFGSNGNSGGISARPSSSRNVLFVEIARDKEFVTPGTGTATTVLVGPVFRDVGPYVDDIVVHGKGRNVTGGFTYTVKAQFSYDGESWEDFAGTLLTVATANVTKSQVSSAYTARTSFGRHIRFVVEVNDGNTGVAKAQLSLSVAFHFLA